jgi:hypothetical protein
MEAIAKETFCVLTYADKVRVYLYYTNRPVSAKALAVVAGTQMKNIYGILAPDIRANNVARTTGTRDDRKFCYHYSITTRGLKAFENKRQFLCIFEPKIQGMLDIA